MKSITYEVTERVRVWYRTMVEVTEEDVRRYLLSEMHDIQASPYLADDEKARIVTEYQRQLEEFVDDEDHDIWEAVAIEKFRRPDETIDEDSEQIEAEQVESAGWDGEEEKGDTGEGAE